MAESKQPDKQAKPSKVSASRDDLFIGTDSQALDEIQFTLKYADLINDEGELPGPTVAARVDPATEQVMRTLMDKGKEWFGDFPRTNSAMIRRALAVYIRALSRLVPNFKNAPRVKEVWVLYLMHELERAALGQRQQVSALDKTLAMHILHVGDLIKAKQFDKAAASVQEYYGALTALAELESQLSVETLRKARNNAGYKSDVDLLIQLGHDCAIPEDDQLVGLVQ